MSGFPDECLAKIYIERIQESPTLELANDCFRFVTGYFEIISASSPHIYHSALALAPQESIVRKLYESHTHPFTRVVRGLPMLWDTNTAATTRPSAIERAAWSPCNRFIAITWGGTWDSTMTMDVLDSVTLQRLQTLEPQQGIDTNSGLVFSPDSRILTSFGYRDHELYVESWDLQTGGIATIIRWQEPWESISGDPSITYSANGQMVAVCFDYRGTTKVFVCDVVSGVHVHSHSLDSNTLLSNNIWTHGESMRFATISRRTETITICEVGFTSGATLTEVEIFPAPDGHGDFRGSFLLLPTPCRLALAFRGRVLVHDVRSSKSLLCYTGAEHEGMSFSSDGRFFAYSSGSGIYLWKESPTGYIPHEKLATSTNDLGPLLSPNGESIVAFSDRTIRLWRTKYFTTPLSRTLTRAPQCTEDFALDFSPDGTLAVVAMQGDNMVTVLNLKSGVPRLTIDASMEVFGLGVIGNTVVVIGLKKAITWNLPAGDHVPDARVGLEDSSRTVEFSDWYPLTSGASISPDSRHIALVQWHDSLFIYNASTGGFLGSERSEGGTTPWFSPDGCDVWCANDRGEAEGWRVGGGQKVLERLKQTVDIEHPPEGYPWGSSRGYRVTNDRWVLGPDGKRLLMLPPHWQSYAVRRVWKGEFLVLLHGGLSEPVILELDVNP